MNARTAATTQPVRTGIDTPMTSGWDVSGHRLSTAEVESAIVAHDRLTHRAQQPQRGQIMPAADHDVVPEPRLRD
ncbi:MAG: hypothetical protein M3071_18695, partial [Actinomycetota bacterium]|nr:hypothetical protein [Actinomycetota bacterium]